ncbi:ABC transporter ATP-binding protein [Roseomonas sp. AR75]|uniref:ABC transporter ATP-binding protein n=1 Tax=Roseomonas sp. AR75 TaxID=2562311 RepID=UPI0010C140B3|nr:ABC transporter ATP-binding protein [Roseomonas sp. AR75]
MTPTDTPLLRVENLSVRFAHGTVTAVNGVSFAIGRGETLGLVGESGSGKSVTSLAVMGLLPHPAAAIAGTVTLALERDASVELLSMPQARLRDYRGAKMAMIFQDPMTSLNPVLRVGEQIAEAIRLHEKVSTAELRRRVIDLLTVVGIPEPALRAQAFPHQMSGGMCQRVMIAMALACKPQLLIADEPTTALDVTIQAQILETIKAIQAQFGMGMLFISHDLGVVAEVADRVAVMYAGRIVETGPAAAVLHHPAHPYTQGLIRSIPRIDAGRHEAISAIRGAMPDMRNLPPGCSFHPRCDRFRPGLCDKPSAAAEFHHAGPGHHVRCERIGAEALS